MNDHMPVVKMYKEETVCCECGRYIKNVVEIDGVQYGTRCCEKHLPRHYSVKKGAVVINTTAMKAEAETILGQRFVPFWIKSDVELDQYVNKVGATDSDIRRQNLKAIALILAIRRAA